MREDGALDPFKEGSADRADEWAQSFNQAATGQPAELADDMGDHIADFILVSSDPEDLTLKQARLLGEADVVCAHGDIGPEILARARADAVRVKCDQNTCPRAINADGLPDCMQHQANATSQSQIVILRSH